MNLSEKKFDEIINFKINLFKADLIETLKKVLDDEILQKNLSSNQNDEQKMNNFINSFGSQDKEIKNKHNFDNNNAIDLKINIKKEKNEEFNFINFYDKKLNNSFDSNLSTEKSIKANFDETIPFSNGLFIQLNGNITLKLDSIQDNYLNSTAEKLTVKKLDELDLKPNDEYIKKKFNKPIKYSIEDICSKAKNKLKEDDFKKTNKLLTGNKENDDKKFFFYNKENKTTNIDTFYPKINTLSSNSTETLINNRQTCTSNDSNTSTVSALSIETNSNSQIENDDEFNLNILDNDNQNMNFNSSIINSYHETDQKLENNLALSKQPLHNLFLSSLPQNEQSYFNKNSQGTNIFNMTSCENNYKNLNKNLNVYNENLKKNYLKIENFEDQSLCNIDINKRNKRSLNEESNLTPKIKKILKSYQELASSSLNGPEYYENMSMLANFQKNIYSKKNSTTFTAAAAAAAFLNGTGSFLDTQTLFNKLIDPTLFKNENNESEILNYSMEYLKNFLDDPTLNKFCSSKSNSINLLEDKVSVIEDGLLSETILKNELISCFNVGGEMRLCLPQILTTVLRDTTLQQINIICDLFQIYCSRCTASQLNKLKQANILPPSVPSCGLITKSDAERLCGILFLEKTLSNCPNFIKVCEYNYDKISTSEFVDSKIEIKLKESKFILNLFNQLPNEIKNYVYEDQILNHQQIIQVLKNTLSFKVIHKCFGKSKGLLIPAFYYKYNSRCILCLECESLLSPSRFVCHTHQFKENHTCHWGFDPSKWRHFINLTKDDLTNIKMKNLKVILDEFKFHKVVN